MYFAWFWFGLNHINDYHLQVNTTTKTKNDKKKNNLFSYSVHSMTFTQTMNSHQSRRLVRIIFTETLAWNAYIRNANVVLQLYSIFA